MNKQIKHDVKQFAQSVEEVKEISEQAEEPMPFEQLYHSIQTYNEWLVTINQGNLTNSVSMAIVPFTMTDYGLPDEVFGVLRIPAMDLEMPIYLGAKQVGDLVYIKNVWEELAYKVTAIRIVYQDDIDAILIQPGKDMVMLMTCHPPNTGGRYRYLVYCERAKNEGADA